MEGSSEFERRLAEAMGNGSPGPAPGSGQIPPIFTTLKRTVYTVVNALGYGEPAEVLPDMQLNLVDDSTKALQFVVLEGGVQHSLVFFVTDEIKAHLLKMLTGGVDVVSDGSKIIVPGAAPPEPH